MATTTTSFGWDIPQSSDLVKDGATAIATLGQDIDTSMTDLLGGTTGQVLSKASNTDMDFTWVAPTTGDITGVTAGTGLTGGGTSGTVTLDFDVANYGGGQYSAGKNKIINGDFGINQRNFTSNTTTLSYNFDRWLQFNGGTTGTLTVTPQTFTLGAAPVAGYESTNYLQGVTASGASTNTFAGIAQKIESVRTFAGQTVTISFWAKAASGTPKISTEVTQNFGTGGSPSSEVNTSGSAVTISTSWARYSTTISIPSISGKTLGTAGDYLQANLWLSAGSALDSRASSIGIQNNTFSIWGVQVEAGSTATPFQTATGTKQGELAACQRYYYRTNIGSVSYAFIGVGNAYSSSGSRFLVNYPVQMRTTPTAIDYSTLRVTDDIIYDSAVTALTIYRSNPSYGFVDATSGASMTQYRTYFLSANASTSAYLGFTAEL